MKSNPHALVVNNVLESTNLFFVEERLRFDFFSYRVRRYRFVSHQHDERGLTKAFATTGVRIFQLRLLALVRIATRCFTNLQTTDAYLRTGAYLRRGCFTFGRLVTLTLAVVCIFLH